MTQKRVKASDVIGNSYYIYTLQSSNNTPSLNSTINITCNVTDVYGQAISGKSITLYQNNTSKGAKTTDSNGNASWNNISVSGAGLQTFKVENSKIEVFVDNKSDVGHTHSQYLTEHQDLSNYVTTDDSRLSDARIPKSHTHTKSQITDFPSLATVATSGSYNDLTNKPTIPEGVAVDTELSTSSNNAIANSTVTTALNGKSDSGHTHSNYLTSSDISGKIDTAGTGLSKSGTTLNHSNSVTALTTASLKKVKYDAQGHITGTSDVSSSDLPSHTHSQYLTSHQSLSGYLQTSDVKDNLTSTDTNKPLSANQGKELKALIDNKEDNIYRIVGTGTSTYSNRIRLNCGTFPFDSANEKILVYVVPDIASLSASLLVDLLGAYPSGVSTAFPIKKSNDTTLTIGEIRTGDELLLFYADSYWRLIGNSSISGKIDSAGTGLSKSGTTLNHSNSVTALTTASFKKVKYDSQGHITGTTDVSASDLPSHNHTKSQITDFPTIPSKTSDLTNDSGFLTSHQSLTGYLQTSDVKDNLTSTDTNKPLSANQGKELKALIDNKEDNIYRIVGTEVSSPSSSSARLHCGTLPFDNINGKIITYVVPDISTLSGSQKALIYGSYPSGSNISYNIFKSNNEYLTIGDIQTGDELLLMTEGNVRLISNSSISNKEDKSNKVTSISSSSTDTQYPSAKAVDTYVFDAIEPKLAKSDTKTLDSQYMAYGTYNSWELEEVFGGQEMANEVSIEDDRIEYQNFQGRLKFTNNTPKRILLTLTLTSGDGAKNYYSFDKINYIDLSSTATTITLESDEFVYLYCDSGNSTVLYSVRSDKNSIGIIVDMIYPVGSIYMNVNPTDPQILFGGTWTQLQNRFLIGAGGLYTNGDTGGETTHTLTTSEMPSHTHTQNAHYHRPSTTSMDFLAANVNVAINGTKRAFPASGSSMYEVYAAEAGGINEYNKTENVAATNQNTGGGGSHNNMPPYLAVYIWKRIA